MKDYLMILLKHKGALFLLPVIAGFFLLWFLNHYYSNLYEGDYETIKTYVIPNLHLIVSLMSCWWIVLLLLEFTSSKGNEVLYLYFSLKDIVGSVLFLEVLYIAIVSLYFMLFCKELGLSLFFLALLCGESLFIGGLSFLIIQLTKNTSIALGIIAVYCVYLLKFDSMHIMDSISIFPLGDTMGIDSLYQLAVDFVLAIMYHLVGGLCYKKRILYH